MAHFHCRCDKSRCVSAAMCLCFLSACSKDIQQQTGPTGPVAPAIVAASNKTPRTIDDEFVDIAAKVHGFAGLSFDSSGTMTVYITDQAQSAAALVAASVAVHDRQGWTPARSEVKLVRYDFSQLEDWMTRLIQSPALAELTGFIYIDANELTNRVEIGVEDTTVAGSFNTAIAALGVPREAVEFRRVSRLALASTLQDSIRPVRAGLALGVVISAVELKGCTLGPNAYFSGSATKYFLANSHCSKSMGVNDHVVAHQPWSWSSGTIIADEYSDPPFLYSYNNDQRCPAAYKCRYSDAALFKYRSVSVDQGYIARTQCRNCASVTPRITIDATRPRFRISQVGNYPYAGQWLNKMGRTTGWTYGSVFGACANFAVPDTTGLWLMCQYSVNGNTDNGDSGSPYFELDANDNALLEGMLFAGALDHSYGVLSPIGGIWFDLGSNLVFTP